MKNKIRSYLTLILLTSVLSCSDDTSEVGEENIHSTPKERGLITGYEPVLPDGNINVVIEIPAGTSEKWEVDKTTEELQIEMIHDNPRIIEYLPYPVNYGMIPKTLLPKASGGDGDPLDVMVLGPSIERGTVLKCKLIGVLHLTDNEEKDDKLIAVTEGSAFYELNDLDELNDRFHGITKIIFLWFSNYKGQGKMVSHGFGDKNIAKSILEDAINSYKKYQQQINI